MKKSKTKNTFLVLIFLSTALLLFNKITPLMELRKVAVDILFPSASYIQYPFDSLQRFGEKALSLRNMHSRLREVKKEKEELKLQYRDLNALLGEYNLLREVLDFREFAPPAALAAEVLLHTPEMYFEEFIINRGAARGVQAGDAVVKLIGPRRILLGRVKEVFEKSSKVLLLTSSRFRAGARTPAGTGGVVTGKGGWNIQMQYIEPEAQIEKNEEIYTCSTGGMFPRGLALGKVGEIYELEFSMGKKADIKPFFYPQNARYVYVVPSSGGGDR